MSPHRALLSPIAVTAAAAPAGAGVGAGGSSVSPPPAVLAPTTLAPSLTARLAGTHGSLPVLVTLRDQVPGGRPDAPRDSIRSLRRTAQRSQPALLARMAWPARRLWLTNALALRASPAEIRRLAADPAVARSEGGGDLTAAFAAGPPERGYGTAASKSGRAAQRLLMAS